MKKKNTKITLIVTLVGVVVCTFLRFIMITAFTDMTTGFLHHGSEGISIAYYASIAAFSIAVIFTAAYDEKGSFGKRRVRDLSGKKAVAVGFAALLIAVCAFFEGLGVRKLITSPKAIMPINIVFSIYICVVAFATLYKKKFTPLIGFSYSIIGVYYLIRGILNFSQRMVITGIADYLLECMIPACGAVSFVIFARFLSGNMTKKTKKSMCFWGGASVIMSFSYGAAIIQAKLLAPAYISERIVFSEYSVQTFYQEHQGVEPYLMRFPSSVNLALGVFCAVILTVLFIPGSKKKQAVEANNSDHPELLPDVGKQPRT